MVLGRRGRTRIAADSRVARTQRIPLEGTRTQLTGAPLNAHESLTSPPVYVSCPAKPDFSWVPRLRRWYALATPVSPRLASSGGNGWPLTAGNTSLIAASYGKERLAVPPRKSKHLEI